MYLWILYLKYFECADTKSSKTFQNVTAFKDYEKKYCLYYGVIADALKFWD